jgi:predicted AlkP superfamily pyrophosphatase or phosphodiesterase
MKIKHFVAIFTLVSIQIGCVNKSPVIAQAPKSEMPDRPKLVVGIVVDQMRYDYLYRFYDRYGEGGLKRLMNDGFNCRNNHYHYATTVTGPGHAHIYNGSVPAISGIIGNGWHDRNTGKEMYVAGDSTVNIIGEGSDYAGKMSPKNMLVTSITDQLRLSNEFQSKVVGVAIKDRGAILPAGHTGDAYWYDSRSGNWITSSFYKDQLPSWVKSFNDLKLPESYTKEMWTPLYDINTYTETEADDQPYEASISGESKAVFPHKVTMGSISQTPYGNYMTRDFAIAAIEGENLGKGKATDFLAVSFSAPDYAGHAFGPHSKEIEDIYLRFDKDIELMLAYLDTNIGEGEYTVFLTADHGVADIPSYTRKNKIAGGLLTGSEISDPIQKTLDAKFGEGKWVESFDNYQLYLNHELLKEKNISVTEVYQTLRPVLTKQEGIYELVDLTNLSALTIPEPYKKKVINMYNPKRSGDLMILVEPSWLMGYTKGTTHGSMWAYDTHVPLLWYGWGIKKGETVKNTYISDIAPSLAILLKILEPNGSVGTPIEDLFD